MLKSLTLCLPVDFLGLRLRVGMVPLGVSFTNCVTSADA